MNVPVKIKKLHPTAVIPSYAKPLDAGFDLVAIEDVLIPPGETVKIRTGLAMAIPPGYEVQVRPRSGASSKTKLRVILGTIDSGYRGEIGVIVDNTYTITGCNDTKANTLDGGCAEVSDIHDAGTYLIRRGDRIAQGILAVVPTAVFEETDELDETERGAGGFGSSGTR